MSAKKIALLIGLALGFVLLAASAFVLMLPRLIDLESVKRRTAAIISEKTGAVVRLDQVALSYFPRLRVTVSGVKAELPEEFIFQADSLNLYPSLLHLLSGKVEITAVRIQSPVITIRTDKKKPPEEEDIDAKMVRLLTSIAAGSPGLEVSVRDGLLDLAAEGKASLTVKNVDFDADFGHASTEFTASGSTGFMKRLDIDIDVRTKDKSITTVALKVKAKEVDIIRLRESVLPYAGEVPVVRTIFSYLKGGYIPALSVGSEATSIKELGNADNIVVRGDISKGSVHAPGTVLELSEITGTCSLAKGLLEAENVTGMLGGTRLRNARLKVGVKSGDAPFHLETDISSTISEAAGLTERVLEGPPAFLSLLRDISGPFEGRLVLGESTSIFRAGSAMKDGMVKLTARMKTDFAQIITIDLSFRQDGARFAAEVRGLDLQGAGSGLRAFSGEIPALEKVFGYLSAGLMPVITFSATGATHGDLVSADHMIIRGELKGGRVSIPEAGLAFNKVDLRYSVEKGILSAAEIRAGLDETGGGDLKNGALMLAFGKGDGPFHLEADAALTAEAAQRLLRRFVKEPVFPLDRLQDLRGKVAGKVTLGESTAALAAWKENGIFGFDGRIELTEGPSLDLSMKSMPGGVDVRRLQIRDSQSDAEFSLKHADKHINGKFDGTLTTETLAGVIRMPDLQKGLVRGSIGGVIDLETITKSTVSGSLSLAGVPVLLKEGLQLNIKTMDLRAAPGVFFIDAASVSIGDTDLALKGTIKPGQKELVLDADLSARRIDWAKVKQLFPQQMRAARNKQEASGPLLFSGIIRVFAEDFLWDKYTIAPLRASIELARERTEISVNEAVLCGISAPGKIILEEGIIDISFRPFARDRDLLSTAACLSDQKSRIRGTFSLEGNLKARGKADELLMDLKGDLSFSARNGGIDRAPGLARVISFIDLSEIFSDSIPDVGKEQFPYRSIAAKGDLKNGSLLLRDAVMDVPSFKLVATGEINYVSETVDIRLLAAPMKTLDSIVKRIPIVREITGGTLVAVPVHVTGKIKDPKVRFLPLSGVGSGLLRVMERTIKLPVSIFQPSAPAEGKQD